MAARLTEEIREEWLRTYNAHDVSNSAVLSHLLNTIRLKFPLHNETEQDVVGIIERLKNTIKEADSVYGGTMASQIETLDRLQARRK